MTETVQKLKEQVTMLTPEERADLAYFLLQSLDEEEEGAEAAWDAVLARRAEEIRSGKVVGKPAAQVFAELRAKYP